LDVENEFLAGPIRNSRALNVSLFNPAAQQEPRMKVSVNCLVARRYLQAYRYKS
jgi:hypothetical protein